jgi:TetR/AcrR family transcriptional repressor of nem operon
MMNPGPEKQFDRSLVLGKALNVFWSNGYEKTGMTLLVEELGIGRQSLYNTFGDKRKLFIEALTFFRDSQMGQMIELLEKEGSPLENIREICKYWETDCSANDFQGCMLGNTCAEFGDKDPEIAQFLQDSFLMGEEAFFKVLERAKQAGELRADLNSLDLARLILNTGQGLSVVSKVKKDKEFAISVLRSIETLIESFVVKN